MSSDLIRQFRHLRALVIGDAMLDTYLEGTATRLCSEGPVPVVRKTAEHHLPGGAANTAVNARELGAEVMFLSVVGRDGAAALLREALRKHGVQERWLVERASVSTLHKVRILADGQYVVRFDEGEGLDAEEQAACAGELAAKLEQAYQLCDLVIVSDYRYGVLSEGIVRQLQLLHARQPKVLLIDSKALMRFRELEATVVTPNYQEASALIEVLGAPATVAPSRSRAQRAAMLSDQEPSADLARLEHIGAHLLAVLKTKHVAITLGEAGVYLLDRERHQVHLPAHPVEHPNDVGAGDSFATTLGLALAAGGTMRKSAQIALEAAGIAVTKHRTAVVQHQELLQRVSLNEYIASTRSLLPTHSPAQDALAHLSSQLEVERLSGRKVVFTNGVFDLLHAGHVQFLRRAKELGDVLVVGVNSDRSVQRLKGKGRPINDERNRVALVAGLDAVDHVILFDEDTPAQLIRALRPAIHVKGGDYVNETLPEAEAVREVGGQVVILPLTGDTSTSSMIDRILALARDGGAEEVPGHHESSASSEG